MTNKRKLPSNRNFGVIFFLVFLLIALYPLTYDGEITKWSIAISLIFLILGLLNSRVLTPINLIWIKFGILLGRFIAPLVMGAIFFFVVTPIGVLMRILNKDLLNLKIDKQKNSYWINRTGPKSKMKNQF